VLQEKRIPIDLVIGTNIGPIVVDFCCAGVSVENLASDIYWKDILNFRFGALISMFLNENLFSNETLEKFISENMGEISFNQLKTPLLCVATDLNTGERVLLRKGNVCLP
jgi:NTE family protein